MAQAQKQTLAADFTFGRLSTVPLETLAAQMSDPRLAEHLPLLTGPWTVQDAQAFVALKENYWQCDGLGHWAIFSQGRFVGWGGFQKEEEGWDYGLVLCPECFGMGVAITRQAMAFARADPRIPHVTFLLPPSRRNLGALARLGAEFVGEVRHDGVLFLKFQLSAV